MTSARPASSSVADYLGMARRHWWIVLLAAGLGTGVAATVTAGQPRVYRSSTSVLVQPTGTTDANVVGGRTRGEINLDTEAQLVRSTAIAIEAGKLLRIETAPEQLARQVAVEVPANSSVLVVTFNAGNPRAARDGSHAFAEAYLRNREGSARADLASQTAILEARLKQLTNAVAQINARMPGTSRDSTERENLESQRETTRSQINTLAGRLNQLSTSTVSAGKIISDARLPVRPTKPRVPVNLGTGLMIGLLVGLLAGFARERWDRRVQSASEVPRRTGLAVLAQLPRRVEPRPDDVFPPYGSGGRTFNRLRNEILASLGPTDQVIVVTGASRGCAVTLVAANLAAALARTGSDVVLVCAHLPDTLVESLSVTRMLGVGALPGLSDVLAGRVTLSEALQQTSRIPWLRVVTTGGAASAAGLVQSQQMRDTLATLRSRADYVVVEAPSTAVSADAQSLAGAADAAVVVVELRRTRHVELADAAAQLSRIGTALLGTVVVARTPPATDGPAPAAGAPTATAQGGTNRASTASGPAPSDEPTVVMQRLDPDTLATLDASRAAATASTVDDKR